MSLYSEACKSQFFFREDGNIEVRDAVIFNKNFAGEMNRFGQSIRTFSLSLPEEVAKALQDAGWNIWGAPGGTAESADPLYATDIVVNDQSKYPPVIVMYIDDNGERGHVRLQPERWHELDNTYFESADILIHPYEHNRNGYRYKGYLNKLHFIKGAYQSNDFGGKYDEWERRL